MSRQSGATRTYLAAAVALVFLVLVACADDSGGATTSSAVVDSTSVGSEGELSALIEAAQEEGTLTFYTGGGEEEMQEWVTDFENEYGIDVVVLRATSGPLWERFAQETRAGQHAADTIFLTDRPALDTAVEDGWIAEYVPENHGDYPETFKREGYFYGLATAHHVLAYNPDRLSDAEKESILENDLLIFNEFDFSGRVGSFSLTSGAPNYASMYSMTVRNADTYGWDLIAAVAATEPAIFESTTPMREQLTIGEIGLGFLAADSALHRGILDGAPVQYVYPREAIALPFYHAISANAPHPNAARLFMEWSTTPQAVSELGLLSGLFVNNERSEDKLAATLGELPWWEPWGDRWEDWSTDSDFLDAYDGLAEEWRAVMGLQE